MVEIIVVAMVVIMLTMVKVVVLCCPVPIRCGNEGLAIGDKCFVLL